MQYILRSELMNELNMLKKVLKDAEQNGEISHDQRCKIMSYVGKMKTVLYSDVVFKELYAKHEYILVVPH